MNELFAGWPAAASDLVRRAIERHGGEAGRERLGRLRLRPLSAQGLLLRVKGFLKTFELPEYVDIDAVRARAHFHAFPRAGEIGVFERGRVGLGALGNELELDEHRSTFEGFAKLRRWEPRDALYFFGYALTHYHALPWSLADAELLAFRARSRRIVVEIPATVHTHSARQAFYFDESGLIVRHDYVADVIGPFARGAHDWLEYTNIDGVPIATRRRVRFRLGSFALPLPVLDVRFEASLW